MNEFDFGPLTCYIEDENITDINYNGKHLWIDHLTKGRYCEYFDEDDFIKQFCFKAQHIVESFCTQILTILIGNLSLIQ